MTAVPDPRFRDQLAEARPLADQFSKALREHADDCICDRWVTHHSQMLAVVAGRIIAAEVEAQVRAAANQRAAEMQAALDRVEAVCRELDASFRGSNIMGRIRRAAALASPAPAPRAEEGQ